MIAKDFVSNSHILQFLDDHIRVAYHKFRSEVRFAHTLDKSHQRSSHVGISNSRSPLGLLSLAGLWLF